MKNELHILNSYVGILMMGNPANNNTELLKSIGLECERLKDMLLFSFNQANNRYQVADTLNTYYSDLIKMANVLWTRAREHNPIARSALLSLISLIDYTRQHYHSLLAPEHTLAAFELFKLQHFFSTELAAIKSMLLLKSIAEPLVNQIQKAFTDLFKEDKRAVFSYTDKKYFDLFLPQLKSLALDERNKNWDNRLRQLLIKYNFNHMGIYGYFEAVHKKFGLVKNYKTQLQLLNDQKMILGQIQVKPNIAYHPEYKSLKTLLLEHLKMLKSNLKEKEMLDRSDNRVKIDKTVSVDEQALLLHYEYAAGVYNYATKKEAAAAIIAHTRSKGASNISLSSLIKIDKIGQRAAAANLDARLAKIREQLAEDFDL